MKNLGNMLKEAQKLQSRMAEMQEKLAEIEITGQAGGGMVAVTLNGKGEMRKVKIDPSLADPAEIRTTSGRPVRRGRTGREPTDRIRTSGCRRPHPGRSR